MGTKCTHLSGNKMGLRNIPSQKRILIIKIWFITKFDAFSGFNRLTRPAKIYICLTQVICWTILLRFSLPLVTNTDLICNLDNLKAQETPGKERKSKRIAFALKVPGVSSAEGYCSFLARTWVMFRPKTSTSWTGWRPKSDLRRVDILEHFGWLGFWFWGVVQGVINVCYRPRVRLCGEEGEVGAGQQQRHWGSSPPPPTPVCSTSLGQPQPRFQLHPHQPSKQKHKKTCLAQKFCIAQKMVQLGLDGFAAGFDCPSASPNLSTSVCHSASTLQTVLKHFPRDS